MRKAKVMIVGGGFSGVAAAIAASKVGSEVTLLERTDMLGGAGLRAGRFNHNGKIVACEETKALGAPEVFEILESIVIHKGNIIDEENVSVYNTMLLDTVLLKTAENAGVKVHLETRASKVEKEDGVIKAVISDGGERFEGDVFVDASGSFGGISNCTRYGRGCVMCSHRCIIFGDRISIATLAGAEELTWLRPGGVPGKYSPSVTLFKESLSPELQARLRKERAFSVPIPEELIDYSRMAHFKGLRGPREVKHVNVVDNGTGAKCVGMGFMPLRVFRKIPGFETAQYLHPMEGGKANFVNHLSMAPREKSLQVKGFKNVFVAGEKSNISGIDEVISSGALAGRNAAKAALGLPTLELPRSICVGDFVAETGERMETKEGRSQACSMAHGTFLERMKNRGFYPAKSGAIRKRVEDAGLGGVLTK